MQKFAVLFQVFIDCGIPIFSTVGSVDSSPVD